SVRSPGRLPLHDGVPAASRSEDAGQGTARPNRGGIQPRPRGGPEPVHVGYTAAVRRVPARERVRGRIGQGRFRRDRGNQHMKTATNAERAETAHRHLTQVVTRLKGTDEFEVVHPARWKHLPTGHHVETGYSY